MLISDIKKYIKNNGSVSMTELKIEFDLVEEELIFPLELLIEKGYIIKTKPIPSNNQDIKCKGCPMGCKPKEQENCSPAPLFNIYKWSK